MQAIRSGAKGGGLFNTALSAVIHELAHLVDAGGILSETAEWRGLVGARIGRVRDAIKRSTGRPIDEHFIPGGYRVPNDVSFPILIAQKVPTLYAATKAKEALAEYTAYMKIVKGSPFPQDVMDFVNKHILSPLTGKVPAQMHFVEAMNRLEEKNWVKAIAAYDKLLESVPGFLSARKMRVTLLFIEKRDEDAISEIGKVIDLVQKLDDTPKIISAYYVIRGSAQRRLRRDKEAIADFTAAIKAFDQNADAFEKRGDLLLKKFQLDRALADLNRSIALNPNSYVARLRRGNTYYYKRQAAKAYPDFDAAMSLTGKNSPRYFEALERRGYALFAMKRSAEAGADLEAVLKADPKRVDLYLLIGQSAFNVKDFKTAIAKLSILADAKTTKPSNLKAESLTWRAQSYIMLGDHARAVPDLTLAIALTGGKDINLIMVRGLAYQGAGNREKAVVDFTTYINKTGGNPKIHARRGLALYDLKRFDESIDDWDKFIAKKPTAFAYYMRGRAWRGAKKLKKAIADFGIAIKKDSKLVEAYVARGGSRLAMGETAKAEADFKKALAVAQPKAKKTVEQSIEEARDKGKK